MADEKHLSALEEAQRSKAALYRLGASLIKNRLPVTLIVAIFTAFMVYETFQIQMSTAFNDLLPYRHPFVQVHFRFANQFGGANNVNVMIKVEKGDVFTKEMLKKIYDNTESIYGQLVSLNGQALLLKANFIEGRIDYRRIFDEIERTVKQPFETAEHTIWIAGEPQLYGWIYHYANEVYYIFIAAAVVMWLFLYFYFHDWRG